MQRLMIKAKIGKRGDEIRRLSIPMPADFESFKTAVVEALELSSRPHFSENIIKFRYEDEEGDMVSILNTADLKEAIRQVALADDNLMRLTIGAFKHEGEAKQSKPEKCASACPPRHAGGCPFPGAARGLGGHPLAGLLSQLQVSLPELLSNPNIRSMAEGLIGANSGLVKIVTNYICDACQQQIGGDRYTSTTEKNFDLCSACMLSSVGTELNKIHAFKKISAFESLIECLQNGGSFDAAFETQDPTAPRAHCATCDMCSSRIVGVRHKCFVCADYDECDQCRLSSAHPHEFYSIANPDVRTIPAEVLAERAAAKQAEEQARKAAKEAEEQARKAAEEAQRAAQEAKRAEEDAKKAFEEAKKAPPAAPKSAFEQNLDTLASMGFTDRAKNIQVLVRNRNKLFESIQQLLSQ